MVFAPTAHHAVTSVTDRTHSFVSNPYVSLPEEQFPTWDAAPPEAKRPEFPGNGFPVIQIYLWGLVMKRLSISILILCACFVPVVSATCYSNWTQFHRANMHRFNPCEKVLNADNVGKLSLKWKHAAGRLSSSPAVANGVVYVGSDNHIAYALKASTGALLWRYTTGGQVQSSPAVANGVVYAGSSDFNMYALNASTGALLWSYTTGGPVFSYVQFACVR